MRQTEKRLYLIKELLKEQPRYKDIEIPEDVEEQKNILRSLMNIRMAAPISDEFEKIQDEYLQEVNAKKGYVFKDEDFRIYEELNKHLAIPPFRKTPLARRLLR